CPGRLLAGWKAGTLEQAKADFSRLFLTWPWVAALPATPVNLGATWALGSEERARAWVGSSDKETAWRLRDAAVAPDDGLPIPGGPQGPSTDLTLLGHGLCVREEQPSSPRPPDRLLGWKVARGEQPLELRSGAGADHFPVVPEEPPGGAASV